MSPTDRYIIMQEGQPVHSCADIYAVFLWCWGRELSPLTVYDYEKPITACCGNLDHLRAQLTGESP